MLKRILALSLAILMASALVLNVSAASSYRNVEVNVGNDVCYVFASCTSTIASARTDTTSRTLKVKTRMTLYNSTTESEANMIFRDTSLESYISSGISKEVTETIRRCVADHYLDGGAIWTGRISPS